MRKLSLMQFSDLAEFDEIIDVRSPGEYAEDHLPGAINLPVLNDAERHEVGTQYKNDEFGGRWRGAAHISANISKMLGQHFGDKPKSYQPLIYCWRGGQRSQSLLTVLGAIGWRVSLLQGGYKAYRKVVVQQLQELCPSLSYEVITGLTGAGKSRLLRHLHAQGEQVLDLEKLAAHRGSLLGDEPNQPQPTQKAFETAIWHTLQAFSPTKTVWVESESRRVGKLFCPEPLWLKITHSPVVELATELPLRAEMLLEDYQHFVDHPQSLLDKLPVLATTHGHAQVAAWQAQVTAGEWLPFVASLLEHHYDPAYRKAGKYPTPSRKVPLTANSPESLATAAQQILG
jgi:tRNA 2-selenouridine synthase